jgi:hypothetical protein
MSEERVNLDEIIRNNFDETIDYLKKNNIEFKRPKLIILESIKPLIKKYGEDNVNKKAAGIYDSETNEIYIIKKPIEKFTYKILISQNENSNNNLFTISNHKVLWPVYKNYNNIEKIIEKAAVEPILNHETGHVVLHLIGGNNEWNASAFAFLVYFYKNELYKYPEVYEIMERNIKICERFIKKKDPALSYSLGSCFANDLIYIYENILNKDKQSPKLNIKNIIEKLKYFSEEEGMDITKMLNTLLKTKDYYIDINRLFNTLPKVLMLLYK